MSPGSSATSSVSTDRHAFTVQQLPTAGVAETTEESENMASAIWTRDLSKAHRVSRAIRAGSVSVNCYGADAHDMTVPFGGYKQSGFGRDKSLHALDKYMQLKTTWIKL